MSLNAWVYRVGRGLRLWGVLTLLSGVSHWGWAQQASPAGGGSVLEVVASGPAGQVTATEVRQVAQELVPADHLAQFWLSPDAVTRFASSLYVQRALAQEALKAGVESSEPSATAPAAVRERALTERYLVQRAQAATPNDKALEALARSEYRARPEQFTLPEQTHVRHILLPVAKDNSDAPAVEAQADALLTQLRQGADFVALAREKSADKASAERGGDLSAFERGRMVPAFEQAAFALRTPGELSAPVRTAFGYHIIQLVEYQPPRVQTFEEVAPALQARLREVLETRERRRVWEEVERTVTVNEAAVRAMLTAAPVTKP